MEIKKTGQSSLPPSDKPLIIDPVRVTMDIPLYYLTERGPLVWNHSIYCARIFADTVLYTVNSIFSSQQLGFVHLGFYNPREARKRDGTPFEPRRWSNHAYAMAGDWAGVMTKEDEFIGVDLLSDQPAVLTELYMTVWSGCAVAIRNAGRKPEIVNEKRWMHIGIWPE